MTVDIPSIVSVFVFGLIIGYIIGYFGKRERKEEGVDDWVIET